MPTVIECFVIKITFWVLPKRSFLERFVLKWDELNQNRAKIFFDLFIMPILMGDANPNGIHAWRHF